jgi:guanosine-3',5'-bis(diphosphate) 3'-pyrophosphohydrolase
MRSLRSSKEKYPSTYEELYNELHYWLLGRKYYKALEALKFARDRHIGLRKDQVTPEFGHQLVMAHFAMTIIDLLMFPEETMIVLILHDIVEDHGVSIDQIREKWGSLVADAVKLISKEIDGIKLENLAYYLGMVANAISSIVKGIDRMHNLDTMTPFTQEKREEYIRETLEFVLPMIDEAMGNFPQQEMAYRNVKHTLITLVRYAGNPPTAET